MKDFNGISEVSVTSLIRLLDPFFVKNQAGQIDVYDPGDVTPGDRATCGR